MAATKKSSSGFNYLLAFIGLVLAAIFIVVAILFLSPGKEIAGFTWLRSEKELVFTSIKDESGENDVSFNTVEIDCDFFNIDVVSHEGLGTSDSYRIFVQNGMSGIVKADAAEMEFSHKIENDVLKFSVTNVPSGLIFGKSSCTIILFVNPLIASPKETEKALKFSFTTTTGKINFGNSIFFDSKYERKQIESSSVFFRTKTGEMTFGDTIETTTQTPFNVVAESAKIYFEGEARDVCFSHVSIDSSANTFFNMLDCDLISNLSMNGEAPKVNVGSMQGNVTFEAKFGMFEAEYIEGDFKGEKEVEGAEIKIDEISGEFTLEDAITANVAIKVATNSVLVRSEKGNVSIGKAHGKVDVLAKKGDVTIENFASINDDATITTESGDIFVGYLASQESFAQMKTETQSGNITIENAKGVVDADSTTGEISVEFVLVSNPSSITTTSGEITITATASIPFSLNLESTKVYVDIADVKTTTPNKEGELISINSNSNVKLLITATSTKNSLISVLAKGN